MTPKQQQKLRSSPSPLTSVKEAKKRSRKGVMNYGLIDCVVILNDNNKCFFKDRKIKIKLPSLRWSGVTFKVHAERWRRKSSLLIVSFFWEPFKKGKWKKEMINVQVLMIEQPPLLTVVNDSIKGVFFDERNINIYLGPNENDLCRRRRRFTL